VGREVKKGTYIVNILLDTGIIEIVGDDLGFGAFPDETVGNGGGSGLVDARENIEISDSAGVIGDFMLGSMEVGGDGDDVVGDFSLR
jgi:hypothetical protein